MEALIFDFDDTLVDTYGLFMEYYNRFADIMKEQQLATEEEALAVLHEVDIQVVIRIGYPSRESFGLAMQESYHLLCEKKGLCPAPEMSEQLYRLGLAVHQDKTRHYDDAAPLLQYFSGKIPLLLLSQGDSDSQLARVNSSGFAHFFQEARIVPQKTAAVYRELVSDYGFKPERCCMIGNSIRSDINPAMEAGLSAIHLLRQDWVYDQVPAQGEYRTITSLAELRELIEL